MVTLGVLEIDGWESQFNKNEHTQQHPRGTYG